MKKYVLILIAFIGLQIPAAIAQKQDSWLIKMNKQVLLRTPVDTNEPVIYLSKAASQGNAILSIQYQSANLQDGWNRTFYLTDEADKVYQQLEMKKQNGTKHFKVKDLQQAAINDKPIFIYTTSLPADSSLAAIVRVRRILLCKIYWKK